VSTSSLWNPRRRKPTLSWWYLSTFIYSMQRKLDLVPQRSHLGLVILITDQIQRLHALHIFMFVEQLRNSTCEYLLVLQPDFCLLHTSIHVHTYAHTPRNSMYQWFWIHGFYQIHLHTSMHVCTHQFSDSIHPHTPVLEPWLLLLPMYIYIYMHRSTCTHACLHERACAETHIFAHICTLSLKADFTKRM
jgi:hypothetical protein